QQPDPAQAQLVQAALSLRELGMQSEQGQRLLVRQANVQANGALADVQHLIQGTPSGSVDWSVSVAELGLRLPQEFSRLLELEQFSGQGRVRRDDQGRLSLEDMDLALQNSDMALTLGGRWRQDDRFVAGVADWSGRLERLNLAALVHYLPLIVNQDARDWMAAGLVQGTVSQGTLMLRGGLDTFPYGLAPQDGQFEIGGVLQDAIIDYQPTRPDRPAWPRLEQVQGSIRMHNDNLDVDASTARMPISDQADIVMEDIVARIVDMEQDALLTVDGRTQAPAASYMGLVHQSPLDALLDGALSDSRGQGNWRVPLSLQVPLNDVDNTRVQGRIQLEQGLFQYMPEAPPLTALKGELLFTENGVSAQSLSGQFLGGPARIKGVFESGKPGLRIDGELTAQGIQQYLDLQGAQRLSGATSYVLLLTLSPKGAFGMTLDSNLKGLALDFPEPLSKPADRSATLKAQWSSDQAARTDLLQISLADRQTLLVHLLRRQGMDKGPYFQGVTVGSPGLLGTPTRGLQVHGQYDKLDIDAWERVLLEFEHTLEGNAVAPRARALFPELDRARLKAGQAYFIGMLLDELDMDSTQQADGRVHLRLQARQVDGTLQGQRQQNRYVGLVTADFARLYVDKTSADWVQAEPETRTVDDNLELPAVALRVQDLRMYGVSLGRFQARGRPQDAGRQWLLDSLALKADGLELNGTGKWILRGEQRGLQLTALSDISDLGRFIDNSGLPKEVLRDGAGTLQGALFWQDFPWSVDKSRISGQVTVDLAKGRFLSVNSRSAKLLELLSLQSLARLSSLDIDLFGAAREGFPFDDMTGRLTLRNGKVDLENYQVVGPAGTIRLQGQVDIQQKKLDLTAVVTPNLDVSGAAIATMFAVNPAVGVGAFLTQWLMQAPLSKSLSITYAVSGDIDNPQLKEVTAPPVPRRRGEPQVFIEP
ncbi:MAG TPA: YhdP family protein, partial [Alcaligenes sp.]|nr:YhdP family protein [Alcaligenes sp.]HRL27326.1 YhdP family protein [Alcaligenes sp.]